MATILDRLADAQFHQADTVGFCRTTSGTPIDPFDAVVASLTGHVRRVVINGDGVIINLGRRRRCVTGSARDAAVVQAALDRNGRCLWPGCRLTAGDDAADRALAGDQFHVDLDLSVEAAPAGTRFTVGTAIIEVTDQPHTGCAKFAARFGAEALRFVNVGGGRELRLRGVNAKVVQAGTCGRAMSSPASSDSENVECDRAAAGSDSSPDCPSLVTSTGFVGPVAADRFGTSMCSSGT